MHLIIGPPSYSEAHQASPVLLSGFPVLNLTAYQTSSCVFLWFESILDLKDFFNKSFLELSFELTLIESTLSKIKRNYISFLINYKIKV